jgi:hypothetical protein
MCACRLHVFNQFIVALYFMQVGESPRSRGGLEDLQ